MRVVASLAAWEAARERASVKWKAFSQVPVTSEPAVSAGSREEDCPLTVKAPAHRTAGVVSPGRRASLGYGSYRMNPP